MGLFKTLLPDDVRKMNLKWNQKAIMDQLKTYQWKSNTVPLKQLVPILKLFSTLRWPILIYMINLRPQNRTNASIKFRLLDFLSLRCFDTDTMVGTFCFQSTVELLGLYMFSLSCFFTLHNSKGVQNSEMKKKIL